MVWRCTFKGGMVDAAEALVRDFPTALAYVYPCRVGCQGRHRQFPAHLRFVSMLDGWDWPTDAVVYRRTALDARRALAVYKLGDCSPDESVVEREELVAH